MLYRFGFVEEELNEFWRTTIEEANPPNPKQKGKQKKHKISKRVEPNVGNYNIIKKQRKHIISQHKDISLSQKAIPRRDFTHPFEINTKSVKSKELNNTIIDNILLESPLAITNIVPEILKMQFSRKKTYKQSDCLIEKCKQLVQRYKKLRKDELLQTELNINGTITNENKDQVMKHGPLLYNRNFC